MDRKIIIGVLFSALLLVVCSRSRQDDCITFRQVGDSVLNGETKLVCRAIDTSRAFVLYITRTWGYHGEKITYIEKRHGRLNLVDPCPEYYHCVWNEAQRSLVITISNTTLLEDGQWNCIYHGESDCQNKMKLDVNVTVKALTRIRGVTKRPPTEGQSYTIYCHVTGGRPRIGVDYEWKRDGVALAEKGPSLTIPEVERSLHGSNYTCAADIGAGIGEHGKPFTFNVWRRPSVSVSGPSRIVRGSTVTMGCSMTDGYPQKVTGVHWLKDGSALSRPATEGGTVDNPNITLTNVTLDDAGAYVCVLSNRVGERHSDAIHMEVFDEKSVPEARTDVRVMEWSLLGGVLVGVLLLLAAGVLINLVIALKGRGWNVSRSERPSGPQYNLTGSTVHHNQTFYVSIAQDMSGHEQVPQYQRSISSPLI